MRSKQKTYARFVVVFAILGGLGIVASLYTLLHERLALPFSNTYSVKATFPATDGLVGGIGQPVNVVGVKVGQVSGVQLQDGSSVVTMSIDRGQLAHVYANAHAVLQPITPLEDLQIDLSPGTPAAGPLRSAIPVGETGVPVPLSDLLSSLDSDTRDYLTSLISSLGTGTAGRGADLNKMLAALGPTAADAGMLARSIDSRRQQLAQLVHNTAIVTHAASEDRQLSDLIRAGDETVRALALEGRPLQSAVAQFPATLNLARTTLGDLTPFARQLIPTLDALQPATNRLPATLRSIPPFATAATAALQHGIRPAVVAAQPIVAELGPITSRLKTSIPWLAGGFQALRYFVNELAYNPGGDNQGFLFWLDWVAHNIDTFTSNSDAHGPIASVAVVSTCYGLQDIPNLQNLLGLAGLCSK